MRRGSFFGNVSVDLQTGCWNWTGYTGGRKCPYPRMMIARKVYRVHRVSAHLWKGFDLRSKLWVLHSCDNTFCCNPKHLFIGTVIENVKDEISKGRHRNQKKTHCIHGHQFTVGNTYHPPKRPHGRYCLRCRRLRDAARYR